MKRLPVKLISAALLLICIQLKAQQPILKIDSKDSANVSLTKLKTEVKVIGNYAVTTMEMEFCNTAPRVLEGELVFPMPEGVTVSRYAIDINGKMREAVPVEKEKGQVVFENIERRNVDPGLLEKVQGNNFRTRIYPIPANGCRRVIIGYEQLLGVKDNYSFLYSLPLHFKQPLKQFDFSITVASNYIPEVGSDCNTHLKFEELNKVFTSSVSEKNYTPDGAFNIIIPKTPDAAEVSMQQVNGQYYFLINTFPPAKKVEKKIPNVITVIWDESMSGLHRDHKKEMELLDAYIKTKSNLTIYLFEFALKSMNFKTYNISGGNWSEMKKKMENAVYDGATDLSILQQLPPSEEYLLFSDGLNTYGNIDNMVLPKKPVYSICASATADHSMLKYISAKTGGAFINLNELDIATAQKYLTEQTLQFLGIKSNGNITEVYPSIATPVLGNCSIAGISSSGNATVTLQFGYGSTVVSEQNIDMNANFQNTNFISIEKIWAQKKIADLDILYEMNKESINALGKKYSVITRNTSLIVLDAVEDYVRYDIEPPAELRGAYAKLMAEKKASDIKKERDELAEARKYFARVQYWWNRYFKPVVTKAKTKKSTPRPVTANLTAQTTAVPFLRVTDTARAGTMQERARRVGRARSEARLNVSRVLANQRRASPPSAQAAAAYSVSSDSLTFSMVILNASPAYGSTSSNTNGFSERISTKSIPADDPVNSNKPRPIFDPFDVDAKLSTSMWTLKNGVKEKADSSNVDTTDLVSSDPSEIEIKELTPDETYLKELNAVAKEDRYKKYLELRKDNSLPPFYFNVANMFFKDGDSAKAYLILSNIAELNLDDHELYKMLGYRLKTIDMFDDEVMAFKKVMQLRPQDPQSYRDYALALADAGKYQQALDTLYFAIARIYDEELKELYPGIEEIIVTEINNLIAQHGAQLDISKINKSLVKNMPVDIRVVLNWNMNATDIDLWVFDPNDEKCYFDHTLTAIGGRISKDFTQGYGPEQFMLKKALKGKYTVMLNYYGDNQQSIAGPTTVMAEIYTNYGKASEQRKMITLQMQKVGSKEVLIGEFDF